MQNWNLILPVDLDQFSAQANTTDTHEQNAWWNRQFLLVEILSWILLELVELLFFKAPEPPTLYSTFKGVLTTDKPTFV